MMVTQPSIVAAIDVHKADIRLTANVQTSEGLSETSSAIQAKILPITTNNPAPGG